MGQYACYLWTSKRARDSVRGQVLNEILEGLMRVFKLNML